MLRIEMVGGSLISFQKLHWIECLSPPFQDGEAFYQLSLDLRVLEPSKHFAFPLILQRIYHSH